MVYHSRPEQKPQRRAAAEPLSAPTTIRQLLGPLLVVLLPLLLTCTLLAIVDLESGSEVETAVSDSPTPAVPARDE